MAELDPLSMFLATWQAGACVDGQSSRNRDAQVVPVGGCRHTPRGRRWRRSRFRTCGARRRPLSLAARSAAHTVPGDRRMHARSEHFNQEAWLEAWTEMDNGAFRYNIVSESGSDYIRTKVLKAVLKREQELVAEGDCQRSGTHP